MNGTIVNSNKLAKLKRLNLERKELTLCQFTLTSDQKIRLQEVSKKINKLINKL